MEREDNFRLKRFKELKYKKQKGDDDTNKPCFCDKKPGKGDDFVCFACRQREEKKKESKKSSDESKSKPCAAEVVGDKASALSTVHQKRLDDLTAHLEKVISLTCQCKLDGLVSPSVDRFIYACKEVRCKLEIEQKQSCGENEEEAPQPCCTVRESEVEVQEPQVEEQTEETFCQVCKTVPEEEEKEEESLGYFETKYKETVKIMKFKNEDGTISEEKEVVTVKREKKHPHKPNDMGVSPCCKIVEIKSISSEDDRNEKDKKVCCKDPKEAKSEEITSCVKKEYTKVRSSISDSGDKRKNGLNEPPTITCCKVNNAKSKSEPPPTSHVCCKKPPETVSSKPKASKKCSKCSTKETAKKDEACECKTQVTSVCCDPVWKDVSSSTSDLAESSEETEEKCICIKDSDTAEPAKKANKATASNTKLCCDKSDKLDKKKSSFTCSVCTKSKKDIATSTSNMDLETKSIKEKSSQNRTDIAPCRKKSKIDVEPQTCCKDVTTDNNQKTCKIRIVSKQCGKGGKEDEVQEFIFFGNILDAIKTIVAPSKSDTSIKTSRDTKGKGAVTKTCSCTSKNAKSLSKKSSLKSSLCKTCDTSSQVSFKDLDSACDFCGNIKKSQSCPLCSKNDDKSVSRSRPRSRSIDSCSCKQSKETPKKEPTCKPKDITSECPVCESDSSKSMKSDTTSVQKSLSRGLSDEEECLSCEIETYPRSTGSSAIDFSTEKDACVCQAEKFSTKSSKSNNNIRKNDKTDCKCGCCQSKKQRQNSSENMDSSESKCKKCFPEEDQCPCQSKKQNSDSSKQIKSSKSMCKICNPDKTQIECCQPKNLKQSSSATMESLESKCKKCFPEEDQCSCKSKKQSNSKKEKKSSKSKCNLCNLNKTQSECCQSKNSEQNSSAKMKPSESKCKKCFPEEESCTCDPKKKKADKPKKNKSSKSKCKICNRERTLCECAIFEPADSKCKKCFPDEEPCKCNSENLKQAPSIEIKPSESKCKKCFPDEEPCKCNPKNLSQTPSKEIKPSESKCKKCFPDEEPCKCNPKNLSQTPSKEIKPSESKCKKCFPDEEPCKCNPENQNKDPPKEIKPAESKCKICFHDPCKCNPENQNKSPPKEMKPSDSKCKKCFPDEDPCKCNTENQNKDPPKEVKATESKCKTCFPDPENQNKSSPKEGKPSESKCKKCFPDEEPCKCNPANQNKDPLKEVKASESKCKKCFPDEEPCKCNPENQNQGPSKEIKPSESKCKKCFPDEEQPCKCNPKNQSQEPPKEIKSSNSKCKICYPEEDPCKCAKNKESTKETKPKSKCDVCYPEKPKSKCNVCYPEHESVEKEVSDEKSTKSSMSMCKVCQTKEDTKRPRRSEQLCCSNQDQVTNERSERRSVSNIKPTNSLCCGFTPRASRSEGSCKKCSEEVAMKDASTSTRRSDRYDVRPLELIMPPKKLKCTCKSDTILLERTRQAPKRCSSCHADYYKY